MLGEGDHVHIAFDHQRVAGAADGRLSLDNAVEFVALGKQWCFGRVQVFRLALVEHAPAKADYATTPVLNGEEDAAAKAVIAPPLVIFDDQSGFK